jgi:hypothetical protein
MLHECFSELLTHQMLETHQMTLTATGDATGSGCIVFLVEARLVRTTSNCSSAHNDSMLL